MHNKVIILTLFLVATQNVTSFNILAIISMPLRSHYMAFQPLFRELALRGHAVTVMNQFPDKEITPNLTYVDISVDIPDYFPAMTHYEAQATSIYHLVSLYNHISMTANDTTADCVNLFENKNSKEHLAKGVKYDVIFVEQFCGECGLAYALSMYEVPIIGITSHVLLPWAYPRLGIPFDLTTDAYYFSNAGPQPSFFSKIESYLMHLFFNTFGKWYLHSYVYAVFDQYVPNKLFDIDQMTKDRMKMMFAYQHFSLTGARLLAPQLLEIGGMHVKETYSITKDIENFITSAKDGVIYFSFGSNLQLNTMSKERLHHFLDGFKKIPQKILWKWENGSFPAGYDNIYWAKWLPQVDILCHPNVLAFITHGGMLSISEAVHCGTPVLAMPFFGDQLANVALVESIGFGKRMFFNDVKSTILADALKELTSEKYQKNAQKISKAWHDRPMSALDSAIYWTEHVARHEGSPPSLPAKQHKWFQNSLIDVYCALILFLIVFTITLVVIVKALVFILCKMFTSIKYKKE